MFQPDTGQVIIDTCFDDSVLLRCIRAVTGVWGCP